MHSGSVIAALNLSQADRTALAGASDKPRTVSTTDGHRVRGLIRNLDHFRL